VPEWFSFEARPDLEYLWKSRKVKQKLKVVVVVFFDAVLEYCGKFLEF